MSDYRYQIIDHNGIECLKVMLDGPEYKANGDLELDAEGNVLFQTHIPIADIQASIKQDRDHLSDHRAVLEISGTLLYEICPGITINYTDTNGHLRDNGTFAQLKERLMLPESYTIVSMFAQYFGRLWHILIESPDFPNVYEWTSAGDDYPRIEPRYCYTLNEETGCSEPHLVDITVKTQRNVPVTGGLTWLAQASMQQATKELNITIKEREAEIDGKA